MYTSSAKSMAITIAPAISSRRRSSGRFITSIGRLRFAVTTFNDRAQLCFAHVGQRGLASASLIPTSRRQVSGLSAGTLGLRSLKIKRRAAKCFYGSCVGRQCFLCFLILLYRGGRFDRWVKVKNRKHAACSRVIWISWLTRFCVHWHNWNCRDGGGTISINTRRFGGGAACRRRRPERSQPLV